MKKKAGILIASLVGLACISGGLMASDVSAQVQSVAYTTTIFSKTSGIAFESAKIDQNGNKGLAISAFKKNAYAVLNEKTTGDYKFAFNGGEFSLKFEGDKGAFSINVKTSGPTITTGVEMNGNKGAIFYKAGMPSGESAAYNRSNRYTEVVAGEKNYLIFRADKMCVYVSNGESEMLVWDFTKQENDSQTIGGTLFAFEEYSVTLQASASEEKIFIYELNGNILETELLVDRVAPSVYAVAYSNIKSGENYVLPMPYAYDLFDGKIEDVNVKIKRGNTVLVHQKYQSGMELVNPSIGEYEIVYSAEDESGNIGEYVLTLACNSMEETYEFVTSYALENDSFGVGTSIGLPNIYYASNYTLKDVPCLVKVTCNGIVCDGFDNALLYEQTLLMDQEGTYEVTLTPVDENIASKQTYVFTATSKLPAVEIERIDVRIGDVLELPEVKTNFAGTEYKYDTIAYYPDGKAYIGNSFEINQSGEYKIEYRFDATNKIYNYTLKFLVNDTIYSFNRSKSYAYIGECTYDEEQTGLNIVLSQGDTFTYSKIIDLSDNTKEDLMLELLMTPLMSGTQELQQFQVILTDVYNPDNYITLDFLDHKTMRTSCYLKMAPAGEILSGYENENMYYHVNQWGTFFRTSLYGVKTEKDFPIKLWFDYEQKQMFVSHGTIKRLCSDLDDYNCYTNIWNGFTTGEVKLTIKGVTWLAPQAGMFLKTVDGESVNSEGYTETNAPVISLDLLGYEENNLPVAVVGKEYPIFNGTAFDSYVGNVKLHTNVYLNYGQTTQTQVSVINGKFVPYSVGRYTIVYTAYDNFGNRAEKCLTMNAVKTAPGIEIETIENDSASVGRKYYLPEVSATGGSGNLIIQAYAMLNGNYVEVDKYCIFQEAGEQTIKFVAVDYLGNKEEYALKVQAEYEENPVFGDAPTYVDVLISGKTYQVKDFTAKFYANGIAGKNAQVKVYLEDKNGRNEIIGNTFIPQVSQSGDEIQLIYEATYENKTSTYSYTIPTLIVNDGFTYNADKYFYVTGGNASAVSDGIQINVSSDASKVYYAQTLLADAFALNFNVNPEKNKVGAIVLWLYDAENVGNAIKVKIINTQGSTSLVSVNDGAFAEMKGSFVGTSNYSFVLTYDNDSFILKDADKFKKTVETNANGEVFNGFASGLVNFAITFEDVSGETQMIVSKINNQTVSAFKFDMVEPQAVVSGGAYARNEKIGTVIEIKDIIYSDVLSINASVKYSVTYNGKPINSTNGVKLSNISLEERYSFKCENYGTYIVAYNITDDSGNTYYYSNVINVADDIPPTISIDGKLASEYKQGDKITLPPATASDNITEKTRVFVAIYTPKAIREYVDPNTEYVFEQKGTYIVKYIAYDAIGNICECSFEVVVK